MYPDYRFATAGGASLKDTIADDAWNRETFIPKVAKRGAAIIEARGLSSAASAANAAIDHIRDWVLGTNGKWVTMGIPSDGSYGIPKDVMFGYPVTCTNGKYEIVQGLAIDEFSQERINFTLNELEEERAGVAHLPGFSLGSDRSGPSGLSPWRPRTPGARQRTRSAVLAPTADLRNPPTQSRAGASRIAKPIA
jgi:malate dehydrogenase